MLSVFRQLYNPRVFSAMFRRANPAATLGERRVCVCVYVCVYVCVCMCVCVYVHLCFISTVGPLGSPERGRDKCPLLLLLLLLLLWKA